MHKGNMRQLNKIRTGLLQVSLKNNDLYQKCVVKIKRRVSRSIKLKKALGKRAYRLLKTL